MLGGSTRQFCRDERGGLTMFIVVLSGLLLVAGGMAVDYQRHELLRGDLQDALDRGVLAATNNNQEYDDNSGVSLDEQAKQVVLDYMVSRNYRPDDFDISVSTTGVNGGRRVAATATEKVSPIFLRLMGMNEWTVTARSAAIQAIGKTEIVLVLDVTESMSSSLRSQSGCSGSRRHGRRHSHNYPCPTTSKIEALKDAAKEFIDTIVTDDTKDQVLVSIVPFSQNVALPRAMADLYSIDRQHDYSSCIDFHDMDFDSTALPTDPATPYAQAQHFNDPYIGIGGRHHCPNANNMLTPFSNDATTLKAAIDSLSTESYTAIYMGAKWGVALLDPSSRPVVSAMIANGELSSNFEGWPNSWNNISVHKITVIMSDGANTLLNEVKDYRYAQHTPAYWDTHYPYYSDINSVVNNNYNHQGDQLLKRICDQAKVGMNSIVYTIGFEVAGDSTAEAALEDCASSASTYYLVEGLEISEAFGNIAREVVNLKLVDLVE